MTMIKYSIIVPHKNNFVGLQRLLKTIPRVDSIQIILVDDHSERQVQEKIFSIFSNDPSIEILQVEACGAGAARNKGMQRAKGKWLLFADSDDMFTANFIEILDTYCTINKDLIYFFPLTQYVKDGDYRRIYQQKFIDYFFKPSEEKCWDIRLNFDVPWSKAVKRSFVEEHGFLFDHTKKQNDTIFAQKVGIFSRRVSIAKEAIYLVIDKEGSISNKKNKNMFNDAVRVRIRSYLLKDSYFNKRELQKYDTNFFQMPLRTVIYSLLDFSDIKYTFSVYKEFRESHIPVFSILAFKQLLKARIKNNGGTQKK